MGRAHVENEKSALSPEADWLTGWLGHRRRSRFPRARARRSFHYTEKRFWLLAPPSASASVAAVTAAELRLEIYDRNWRVGQIGQAGLPCGTEPIINRWAQERNCILHVNSVSRSRLPSAREMGMHKKENKIYSGSESCYGTLSLIRFLPALLRRS